MIAVGGKEEGRPSLSPTHEAGKERKLLSYSLFVGKGREEKIAIVS